MLELSAHCAIISGLLNVWVPLSRPQTFSPRGCAQPLASLHPLSLHLRPLAHPLALPRCGLAQHLPCQAPRSALTCWQEQGPLHSQSRLALRAAQFHDSISSEFRTCITHRATLSRPKSPSQPNSPGIVRRNGIAANQTPRIPRLSGFTMLAQTDTLHLVASMSA